VHLFFRDDISQSVIEFDKDESRHCIKVLRLHKGSIIQITDGNGNIAEAVIVNDSVQHCTAEIHHREKKERERDYRLCIAIAPTKNHDRFEWFVEKATEIGVDEIVPLICEHSERKTVKYERLKNIAIAALKQSQHIFLPQIGEPVMFGDFIESKKSEQKFICTLELSKGHLKNLYKPYSDVIVLIGPEGDFTKEEVNSAAKNGFTAVSLGSSRLRTETAGIVACSIINFASQ
jgi:16S rRNA (uracil1498-N3)-methyltransferase